MNNPIRYKEFGGKKKPLCDYQGNCGNIAYAEVYSHKSENKDRKGWSYLCKEHFEQERKILNNQILHWVLPNKSQKFLKWGKLEQKTD